jgi:pimeloyl-ACP methyl ester carboxylesterase
MHGDLYLPAQPGKHPVVVFAHGSGPATRAVGPFTPFFLQLGIGVLTFDKQGAGESEGEWQTASFDTLAADVIAAIAYVKTRPEADLSKLGVMGSSQGGWIGSMVAAKSKDVSFLLVRVGSGQNVRDTMAHEKRGQYMAEGVTDAGDLDEGIALYHENWGVAARNGAWEDGQAVFTKYSAKPWYKKAFAAERVTKSKSTQQWWTWLGRNLNYDSYDYLKTVTVPVLWTMAEKDWNVNSQKSLPRIVEALELAGNKDHTVMIAPGMGHTGMVVTTGLPNDTFSWQYAAGYWELMEAWLKARKIGQ